MTDSEAHAIVSLADFMDPVKNPLFERTALQPFLNRPQTKRLLDEMREGITQFFVQALAKRNLQAAGDPEWYVEPDRNTPGQINILAPRWFERLAEAARKHLENVSAPPELAAALDNLDALITQSQAGY